eukprot:scaffold157508_cov60-Attheya_sp.AAC.2
MSKYFILEGIGEESLRFLSLHFFVLQRVIVSRLCSRLYFGSGRLAYCGDAVRFAWRGKAAGMTIL